MEGKTIIIKYCNKSRLAADILNPRWRKCKYDMKFRKILSHIAKRKLKNELRNETNSIL